MLVPAAFSRTWYQDDDWHGDWHDSYHENPKPPFRGSKRAAQKSPARIAAKQRHMEPVAKPLSPSKPTLSPSAIVVEQITTTNRHDCPSDETSITKEEREKQARFDTQFGPIGSQDHRYVSQHLGGDLAELVVDEPPLFYLITTYISYMILIAFGRVRDFFGKRFKGSQYKHIQAADGYAALNSDFDNFYFRRLKVRMNECFSRPYTVYPFPSIIYSC